MHDATIYWSIAVPGPARWLWAVCWVAGALFGLEERTSWQSSPPGLTVNSILFRPEQRPAGGQSTPRRPDLAGAALCETRLGLWRSAVRQSGRPAPAAGSHPSAWLRTCCGRGCAVAGPRLALTGCRRPPDTVSCAQPQRSRRPPFEMAGTRASKGSKLYIRNN